MRVDRYCGCPHDPVRESRKMVTPEGSTRDRDWSRLMASAQNGDRRAYEQLLRDVLPFIRTVVARQHRRPDRLEDVVQDVLVTLHRVRHTYDPERSFEN